jgi:uncharacterized membrane protein
VVPLTLLFAATGFLFILLSIPLIRRRVPPNGLYGLRVPATFANEWVWYEANARSGRDLLRAGIIVLVLSLVLPLTGVDERVYALSMAVVFVTGALALAVVGWRRANRLLRDHEHTSNQR